MEANLCFGFSTAKWKDLIQKFDSGDEEAWLTAVGVFERRIRERFLTSIDALVNADTKPDLAAHKEEEKGNECTPGFSIIALCCLLIETLQGFREKPPNAPEPERPCSFPKGSCIKPSSGTNQQFRAFLRRPAFGETFRDDKLGRSFVNGIRNAILHEAETRKWVIWRNEPANKVAAPEEGGYALNRNLFYAAVKQEFESYLRDLKDPANRELRQRFKKKMNDICKSS